jgi:hypothetical protein
LNRFLIETIWPGVIFCRLLLLPLVFLELSVVMLLVLLVLPVLLVHGWLGSAFKTGAEEASAGGNTAKGVGVFGGGEGIAFADDSSELDMPDSEALLNAVTSGATSMSLSMAEWLLSSLLKYCIILAHARFVNFKVVLGLPVFMCCWNAP